MMMMMMMVIKHNNPYFLVDIDLIPEIVRVI